MFVDKPGCWTNRSYLIDFIDYPSPYKRIDLEVFCQLYVEKGLSAAQIADTVGASKQMVLARLRRAGIHRTPGRGRSPNNYRYPNPPFGYQVSRGKLKPNLSELRTIRLIVRLVKKEQLSFEAIACSLNEKKIPARQGGEWDRARVKRVYRRWHDKL